MAKKNFKVHRLKSTITSKIFSPNDIHNIYKKLRQEGSSFSSAVSELAEYFGKAECVIIRYLLAEENKENAARTI